MFVISRLYPRFCIIPAEKSTRRRAVSLKTLRRYNVTLRHAREDGSGNNWIREGTRDCVTRKVYRVLIPVSHDVLPNTSKLVVILFIEVI